MMSTNTTIGLQILQSRGLDFDGYYYWISLGALFGFALLFNIGFIMALSYLKGNIVFLITNVNFEHKVPIMYIKPCYLILQLLELASLFQRKRCLKNMEVKYPNSRLTRIKQLRILLLLYQCLMKVRIVIFFFALVFNLLIMRAYHMYNFPSLSNSPFH